MRSLLTVKEIVMETIEVNIPGQDVSFFAVVDAETGKPVTYEQFTTEEDGKEYIKMNLH